MMNLKTNSLADCKCWKGGYSQPVTKPWAIFISSCMSYCWSPLAIQTRSDCWNAEQLPFSNVKGWY